jgi:glutamine synthetase
MPFPKKARFVIIGAGIHGLSTAWHLAEKLGESKEPNEAFGEKIINSYVKLKNNEINNFNNNEIFSKENPITDWEKLNTLDC